MLPYGVGVCRLPADSPPLLVFFCVAARGLVLLRRFLGVLGTRNPFCLQVPALHICV